MMRLDDNIADPGISADLTVLEIMMAREGLTKQEMKAETVPNDTEIKLEL